MPKKQSTKRKTSNTHTKNKTTATSISKKGDEVASSFPAHLLQDRKKTLVIHPISRKENENAPLKVDKNKSFSSNVATVETLYPEAVFVAKNVLSTSECDAWIEHAEGGGGFEHVSHPATRIIAQRELSRKCLSRLHCLSQTPKAFCLTYSFISNCASSCTFNFIKRCGRIQQDDWIMSERLYQRLKPIIDYVSSNVSISNYSTDDYKPINCNGNLRLYRYNRGMSFGRHYDGSNEIDRYNNAQTEITVLVYLSSCEGGATRFYPPHSSVGNGAGSGKKKKKKKNDAVSTKSDEAEDKGGIAYIPEAGSVLLHVHGDRCLLHEADPVIDGIKYVLRTDVVYGTA